MCSRDTFIILKALFCRSLLVLHSFIAVWRCADVLDNNMLWFMALANILLFLEGAYRIAKERGEEWKWFCPSFFCYLLTMLPAIWLLELDRVDRFMQQNSTVSGEELSDIFGITIPIRLPPNIWVYTIEQSFLFLLIFCRWVLPKGEVTHDQLSQLLFVFIGMASDIMELFVMFDEEPVRKDIYLTYAILLIWSLSLFQFTLVLTSTNNPKKRRVAFNKARPPSSENKRGRRCCGCCQTELWSILVAIFMQDAPFISVRLYALISYQLITYSIIFFTAKNLFVIMLMLYRLFVISCDHHNQTDDVDESEESIYGDSMFMTSESQMSSKDHHEPTIGHNAPKKSQVSPIHRSMPSLRPPSRLNEQEVAGDMLMMVHGGRDDLQRLNIKYDPASMVSSPAVHQ